MDIVPEGYGEIGRKFEEAREDRQQIKDDPAYKIKVAANDLQETKEELRETREEPGQKIDKIGGIAEDHGIRINTLERMANVD